MTRKQLFEAKVPRKVSIKAIMADVNHLANELVAQTAVARDDVIAAAAKEAQKVR